MKRLNKKIKNIQRKIEKILPDATKIITRVTGSPSSLYRSFISIHLPRNKELISVKYDTCYKKSLNKAYVAINKQIHRRK